ncbi:hypothetical protein FNF27_05713 [Cafeteria roenbergensis]|uniref:Uncharacterized protein n=1 Tax=Cafeteria roenbergensis TaxID=33653 RepID=A0A5A8E4Z4_CAFRO|nr:hypothetical protein FNF27_05713 [Cafeteria roenbergensis]
MAVRQALHAARQDPSAAALERESAEGLPVRQSPGRERVTRPAAASAGQRATHQVVLGGIVAAAAAAVDPVAYQELLAGVLRDRAVSQSQAAADAASAKFVEERAKRLSQQSELLRLREACQLMLTEREAIAEHVERHHAVVAALDGVAFRLAASGSAPAAAVAAANLRRAVALGRDVPASEAFFADTAADGAAAGDAAAGQTGCDVGAVSAATAPVPTGLPLPWNVAATAGPGGSRIAVDGVESFVGFLFSHATHAASEAKQEMATAQQTIAQQQIELQSMRSHESELRAASAQLSEKTAQLQAAESKATADAAAIAALREQVASSRRTAESAAAAREKESRQQLRQYRDMHRRLLRALAAAAAALHGAAVQSNALAAEMLETAHRGSPTGAADSDDEGVSARGDALLDIAQAAMAAHSSAQQCLSDAQASGACVRGSLGTAPATPSSVATFARV